MVSVLFYQRYDSLWSPSGLGRDFVAGFSGRKSDDCFFIGIWSGRNFDGDHLSFSTRTFLVTGSFFALLFCSADESEILADTGQSTGGLWSLFLFYDRYFCDFSSWDFYGKLCKPKGAALCGTASTVKSS